MVRKDDPETSAAAAAIVELKLGSIQAKVLQAFRELGPMDVLN